MKQRSNPPATGADAKSAKERQAVYGTPTKHGKNIGSVLVDRQWKPFPADALPETVGNYVMEAAGAIGCDPALVALPLLSALAGAVGTTTRIELKPGWWEPSVIWTAIVGDSGTYKTPAMEAAVQFSNERDGAEHRRFAEEQARYEAERQRHEVELKRWQRKAAGDPPGKPTPPVDRRFLIADVTIEALAERLADNPRGLFVARDELAGWLDSFNQYKGGKGADTAAWLSIHGVLPIRVDRRGGDRKKIYVPSAAVSIAGGIQPPVLSRSLGSLHFQDGLAARMLVAMPPKSPREWTEKSVPDGVAKSMGRIFDRLWASEGEDAGNGEIQPRDLPMTPEARGAWIDFHNRHGQELTAMTGDLAASWSKLEAYAARLSLVCHLAEWAAGADVIPGPVGRASVEAGTTLVEWFNRDTRRVYTALGESDEDRADREAAELIQRRGGAITARQLQQASRKYTTAEAADEALTRLARKGWGKWQSTQPTQTGGRPGRVFQLSTSTQPPKNPDKNASPVDVDTVDVIGTNDRPVGADDAEGVMEWTS